MEESSRGWITLSLPEGPWHPSRVVQPIFHIARGDEWEHAQHSRVYAPGSLHEDGFVHCSYANQLDRVVNANFAGQRGLLLLRIDPTLLAAEVREEPPEPAARDAPTFPHVYGEIDVAAITGVWRLLPGSDGRFQLPADI
jgi:uncharacterized protein (DUF952 family)